MTVKSLRKQLAAAIAMTLVATVALGSSTYAWFVSNTTVKAQTVSLTAKTTYALLISQGASGTATTASDWGTIHTIAEANNTLGTMSPVSTTGKDSLDSNGNILFAASNAWNNGQLVTSYKEPATTDYWKETFEIKASQPCQLFLDTDTVFKLATENSSSELAKTLRLGLVVNKKGETGNANKQVFIYEVDTTTTGDKAANTTDGTDANGIKNAIKCTYTASAANTPIAADKATVAAIDAANYASNAIATLAASSVAVTDVSALTSVSGITPLYEFTNPEEICTITAYIWMEGCDYDCNAANLATLVGDSNSLVVTLGFCAGQAAANNSDQGSGNG